jgi:hypothetical protein
MPWFSAIRLFAALLVLLIAAPARAQSTYRDDARHWQLQLPKGWESRPELAETATTQARARLSTSLINYIAAFKGEGHPYILVQYINQPLTSEEIDQLAASFEKGVSAAREKLGGTVKEMTPEKPVVDRARNRITAHSHVTEQNGHSIDFLTVMHLTGEGAVQVNCYAPSDEYAAALPVLQSIADSVQIDVDHTYVPPPAHWGLGQWVAFGAIGGGVLGGLYDIARRLKGKVGVRTN